jgi:hypothetical protein
MNVEAIKRLVRANRALGAPVPLLVLVLAGTVTWSGAAVSYVIGTVMLMYAWSFGRVYDNRVYDEQNKRSTMS